MKKKILLLSFSLYIALAGFSTAMAQERTSGLAAEAPDTPKRYVGMAGIGYLYGETNNSGFSYSIASPTVQLFNGYRFHRLLAVGGTVGFDSTITCWLPRWHSAYAVSSSTAG